MHEIAKKAREELEARKQANIAAATTAEVKRKAEAEANRRANLNSFLLRHGYAEVETGEIEIEENIFLSGSPADPRFGHSLSLHLRQTCPHCHRERVASIVNLGDLGKGLEEVQLSEIHKSGDCVRKPHQRPRSVANGEEKGQTRITCQNAG